MITREEYNKALDIIEEYHKQIFKYMVINISNAEVKTPLMQWGKFHLLKGRLQFILTEIFNQNINYYNKITYLEDLAWLEFRKIRGAGKKTWDEFVKMRGY